MSPDVSGILKAAGTQLGEGMRSVWHTDDGGEMWGQSLWGPTDLGLSLV